MSIAQRILKLMSEQGMTKYRLAKMSKVPYTTLIKILDGTTKNPQIESLAAVADVFGKSVDSIIGHSAEALIEDGLKQTGISLEELAERAKVRVAYLQKIDGLQPNEGDYPIMDRIARILNLRPSNLRAALARQEPPLPDQDEGYSKLTPEEVFGAFADIEFDDEPLKPIERKVKEELEVIEHADKALKSLGTNIIEVVEKELTEEQILTLAAHRIGHLGPLSEKDFEQIKLALKIALAKDNK